MEHCSIDQLLLHCKDIKIHECLSKLIWKGTKLQRCLFTKMNKDTLCDSLIFIAETLFASTDTTEENQENDNSTSNTQQNAQNFEEDSNDEDSSTQVTLSSIFNELRKRAETTNSNGDALTQSSAIPDDTRPVCKLFLNNRCPTGIKGQNCIHQHPKQCRKFIQGGQTEHGCQNWRCPMLHPKICSSSYLFGSCYRTGCRERHPKIHQASKNKTEDCGNQPFLWQKQVQEQIDKLATTNLQILQVLNQFQQRPVQVWNQTPPHQTPLPQPPRWRNTYSQ